MSEVDHIVKIDGHYETLLKLQKQRQDELFCDIILKVQEKSFPAHRPVLATASDYFMKMFTIDMKDKYNEEFVIESVTAKAMDEVLNCIYTGQFSLTDHSITDILHAASLMQLTSLLETISNFMQSSLNAGNSCLYLKLATMYSFQDVADDVNKSFLNEFYKVSVEPSFLRHDVEKIDEVLASDELVVTDEIHVFDFIVIWVNEDLEQRKQHFPRLFRRVRLQYVSVKNIVDNLRKHELVKENYECRDIVDNTLSYHNSPTVFTAQKRRHCFAPNPDYVMLLPYGKKYQAVHFRFTDEWYNISYEGLTENTILENSAVAFSHPVTVLCGGTKWNKASKQVVRFDSVQWKKMPPMNEARSGCVSVFHDGNLYVFEGETIPISRYSTFIKWWSSPDVNHFSTTYEVFHGIYREWSTFSTPWKTPRSYGAAQAVGDKIYLIGGYTASVVGKQIWVSRKTVNSLTIAFSPADSTWNEVGALNEARAEFGCASLGSRIYVVGGCGLRSSNVRSVEVMDTAQNIWTLLNTNINNCSYYLQDGTACCVKEMIYFFDSKRQLLHSADGVTWSRNIRNTPELGIIIPFARWYEKQSFVKIRKN